MRNNFEFCTDYGLFKPENRKELFDKQNELYQQQNKLFCKLQNSVKKHISKLNDNEQ